MGRLPNHKNWIYICVRINPVNKFGLEPFFHLEWYRKLCLALKLHHILLYYRTPKYVYVVRRTEPSVFSGHCPVFSKATGVYIKTIVN